VDSGYEETVANFFISHFAILNILKSQNCRLHFLIYCDTVSYPYIPPTKKSRISEVFAFSKIAKNSEFEIFKFFGQRFKLASFKNIGVDLAYIGSTGLSE
jgi:hypothetical protein